MPNAWKQSGKCGCVIAILLACSAAWPAIQASAQPIDIPGPPGSHTFGKAVAVLPNGNFVVTDPSAQSGNMNVGRVFLYRPDGTLINFFSGSAANDFVGLGGITVLANGNFVVSSPYWSNDGVAGAGAVTWVDGSNGLSGLVSASNSLVGSITYTVQISMDPQVKPVGHRSFADDKKVGVADWRGGFIPAQDALAAICEMFGEKLSATIASLRANPLKSGSQRLHDFYGIGNGEYWRFSQERNGRVVVERELRLFEKRWLQAKGAGRLRYSWWLLFNGANLYRNRYRLNQRQQKK